MHSNAVSAMAGAADPVAIARKRILYGWKRKGGGFCPDVHDELWGPIPRDFYPFVRRASRFRDPAVVPPKLVRFLEAIRDVPLDEAPAFRGQVMLGRFANDYMSFIRMALKYYNDLKQASVVLRPDQAERARRLKFLVQRYLAMADAVDLSPLTEPDIAGRNIIILQTHSGMRGLISSAIGRTGLPISLVGNGERLTHGPEDFHLVTNREEGLAFGFAKLGKLLRKGPRIVRIFSDGPQGSGRRQIEMFGQTLNIGMGGAALGHFAPSVLFFAATRWEDGEVKADFLRGPLIDPGQSRQRAEDLFADFYADGIKHVLRGAPQDMGCAGGFWLQLRQNL